MVLKEQSTFGTSPVAAITNRKSVTGEFNNASRRKAPSTYNDAGIATKNKQSIEKSANLTDCGIGDWKRSIPYKDVGFAEDLIHDEPHVRRKRAILDRYRNEVESLYGINVYTKWIAILCVVVQLIIAQAISNWESGGGLRFAIVFSLMSYFVGGTICSTLGVVIHECTHGLAAESMFANRCLGLVTNLAIPFPIAMPFQRYHLMHHVNQGIVGKDPDLPLSFEVRLIKGNSLLKILWIATYPAMYVIRGASFGNTLKPWEIVNLFTALATNFLVVRFLGWTAFWYMLASLWLAYSFHPAAMHLIQEHYTFGDGQETYSYYGSLNPIVLNVGYHNEHHDFPKIPWSSLPRLKEIAREFYDPLVFHNSWFGVMKSFVMDSSYGPQSRLVRQEKKKVLGRKQ